MIFGVVILVTLLPVVLGFLMYRRFGWEGAVNLELTQEEVGAGLKYKIDPKAIEEMDRYFLKREEFIKQKEGEQFKEIFG